jgi:hypothetical protein
MKSLFNILMIAGLMAVCSCNDPLTNQRKPRINVSSDFDGRGIDPLIVGDSNYLTAEQNTGFRKPAVNQYYCFLLS